MQTAKLMTNILFSYYTFIDTTAKKEGKTKRQILEEAIKLYITEKKKKEIEEAYKRMAEDKEELQLQKELAAEGMEDFWNIINRDD
jgi:hypothetical protein